MNLFSQLDQRLFLLINRWANARWDTVFVELSALGAWPIGIVALAALAHVGRRLFWRHALVLLLGLLIISAAGNAIKSNVERARPSRFFMQETMHNPSPVRIADPWSLKGNSFPSGHSLTAFYFMTYLSLYRAAYAWWALPLAGLIAFARVYVGHHFPSDCLAGAALGAAGAWLAWTLFKRVFARETQNLTGGQPPCISPHPLPPDH